MKPRGKKAVHPMLGPVMAMEPGDKFGRLRVLPGPIMVVDCTLTMTTDAEFAVLIEWLTRHKLIGKTPKYGKALVTKPRQPKRVIHGQTKGQLR